MEEFTHLDLQKAWKSHGFTQWQIAQELGVSEDTVKSWVRTDPERRITPHPDDVSRIEQVLHAGAEMIWYRWMYSNVESFRDHMPEPKMNPLMESIVSAHYELADVQALRERLERDAIDGRIDDPQLRTQATKEIDEAQAALTRLRAQIGKE